MSYKLLFVCLGNICRSPSAENIMNYLVEQARVSDKILCDSAGTSNYHIGSAPDRRMSQAAVKKLGIKLQGQARQIQPSDLQEFDLILAMDLDNYHNILAIDPSGQYHHKIRLMCDFCGSYNLKEVPDPYYGGSDGFDHVIDLLTDACTGLLKYVNQLDRA